MPITDASILTPAEKLLWSCGCRLPEHIDLEGIANSKGALVRRRHMDGCAARLVTDGTRAIISVESRDSPGRQRFSLAHELAHWINDAGRGFSCSSKDIGAESAAAKSTEANANLFASQLLLPDYMVVPWMVGRKMTLNVAAELGEAFGASVTASAIKLIKRTSTMTIVACHDQQRRRWYVASPSWPFDVQPAYELHQDTVAFEIAFKARNGMSTPRKEPGDRWLRGKDVYRMMVESQSMKLPDDSVLTILSISPR